MGINKIRHQILQSLSDNVYDFENKIPDVKLEYDDYDVAMDLKEIHEKIGYSEKEIALQISFLINQNEIKTGYEFDTYFNITNAGYISLANEKYLTIEDEIEKATKGVRLDMYVKRGTLIATLVTATVSIITMVSNCNNKSTLSKEIEKVNYKLDSLIEHKIK
jgi:penicillin-binding protein-related factor A (putative recombinase)